MRNGGMSRLTANLVAQVVRRVAGQVSSSSLETTDGEGFVVAKQRIEDHVILLSRDAVSLAEELLDLINSRANSYDGLLAALLLCETRLEIGRGCEVVGVRMGLEDPVDGVSLLLD